MIEKKIALNSVGGRHLRPEGERDGKKIVVFMADLQNSYYRYLRNSVPIGMGYVAAYVREVYGASVDIHMFRKFEELHTALMSFTPDLVAFGSYSWNTELTRKTAIYLKKRIPNVVIAVGGPDISPTPSMVESLLKATPEFDFAMPNEGEGPTRELVGALLAGGDLSRWKREGIRGCLSLGPEGKLTGSIMDRFDGDLEDIPSPYLTGLMDPFLADPDYLPIIQTSRGCPYKCTFCVSGKDTWGKMKAFPLERVKAEIDYVTANAAARYLRFADENFGILHRDVEIAEYVVEQRGITDFPHGVSIYTDKHPTDRVKQINLLMRDLLPFNISFQSATESVLRNIKRINLKDEVVRSAVEFANKNKLMLVSELIFPLPGETVATFYQSVDFLIERRFESIAYNALRILKGTEMDLPEEREKYAVRTRFSMSENGYTNYGGIENIEIDETVVSTRDVSEDEFFEVNKLMFMLSFGHDRGYLRELLFFFESLGIPVTELLLGILRRPESCPTFASYADRYEEGLRSILKASPEAVVSYVRERMSTDPSSLLGIGRLGDGLVADMLMNDDLSRVVAEVVDTGRRLCKDRIEMSDDFDAAAEDVTQVTLAAIIDLKMASPEVVSLAVRYDLNAWVQDNYRKPLMAYPNSGRAQLRVRNIKAFQALWQNSDALQERYNRFFATFNSSNRRRYLSAA